MDTYKLSDCVKMRKEHWGCVLLESKSKSIKYYNHPATSILNSLIRSKTIEELTADVNYSPIYSKFSLSEFLEHLVKENILTKNSLITTSKAKTYFFDQSSLDDDLYFSPLGVEIEYTLKCSRNCSYCAYSSNPFINIEGELDNNEWRKVLNNLINAGVFYIRFTGGDPYARKDFNEILKYADSLGFVISVGTDLTLLNDNHVSVLKSLNNLLMIQTTLDGSTAIRNDKHRGKGNFDKVIEGVKILNQNSIPCIVGTVLRKDNVDDIYEIGSLLGSLGVNGYCFAPLYAAGRGHNVEELVPSNQDLYMANLQFKNLIEEGRVKPADPSWISVTAELDENEFKHLLDDQPFLTRQGDRLIRIDSRGNCYVSIKLRDRLKNDEVLAGNIVDKEIIGIWQNSKVLKNLRNQKSKDTKFGMAADVRKINF